MKKDMSRTSAKRQRKSNLVMRDAIVAVITAETRGVDLT